MDEMRATRGGGGSSWGVGAIEAVARQLRQVQLGETHQRAQAGWRGGGGVDDSNASAD